MNTFIIHFNNIASLEGHGINEGISYNGENLLVRSLKIRINGTAQNLEYFLDILQTKNALDVITVTNDEVNIEFKGYTEITSCSRTMLENGLFNVAIELNMPIQKETVEIEEVSE
jgi:hypothetical protein